MRFSRLLTLVAHGVVLHGCASTPPASPPPVASSPVASEPAPTVTPASPAPGRQRVRLLLGQPQTADGLELVLSGYEVERIEGDPEGHYASGIGVTLHLRMANEEMILSELPDGYDSARTAETATHRVDLVAHGSDAGGWVEIDLTPLERP